MKKLIDIKYNSIIIFLLVFVSCSSGKSELQGNSFDNSTIPSEKELPTQIKEDRTISETSQNKKSLNQEEILQEKVKSNNYSLQQLDTANRPQVPDAIDIIDTTKLIIDLEETQPKKEPFHEYKTLSTFLKSHVSASGKVNYSKIKTDIIQLNKIISSFESNYPTSGWTRNEVLSYWINAYNIYTLKLVASNYPVASIKDITSKPWDKKFIKLGGNILSLNDIEHKKIRGVFNEPRIHFALNCASESCPELLNKAYTPKNLNYQLTSQTKRFLNDSSKNDFSDKKNIKVSSLFNWYKEDFNKKEGSVIEFINKYRIDQLSKPQIKYLDYSWELNN